MASYVTMRLTFPLVPLIAVVFVACGSSVDPASTPTPADGDSGERGPSPVADGGGSSDGAGDGGDAGECKGEVIASILGGGLRIGTNTVYVNANTPGAAAARLTAVPKAGGAPVTVSVPESPQALGGKSYEPTSSFVVGDDLYTIWESRSDANVVRSLVGKATAAWDTTRVAQLADPAVNNVPGYSYQQRPLAADSTGALLLGVTQSPTGSRGFALSRVPLDGTAAKAAGFLPLNEDQYEEIDVFVAGTEVVVGHRFGQGSTNPRQLHLEAYDTSTVPSGAASPPAPYYNGPLCIGFAATTKGFYCKDDAQQLTEVTRATPAAHVILPGHDYLPFAVDATNVYAQKPLASGTSSDIVAIAIETGKVHRIACAQTTNDVPVIADGYVYWATYIVDDPNENPTRGAIMRAPLP